MSNDEAFLRFVAANIFDIRALRVQRDQTQIGGSAACEGRCPLAISCNNR
jgi:hypothetical protein